MNSLNITKLSYPKDMATLVHISSPHPICSHQSPHREQCNSNHKLRRRLVLARRSATVSALSSWLLLAPTSAAFDFRLTVPDQTTEEAEAVVLAHARDLLRVEPLLESESWRAAQLTLRESSAYLKQDMHTIIQGKPGNQRASLRRLYSDLFNNVTKLDYAARSRDVGTAKECYANIVAALKDILSRI